MKKHLLLTLALGLTFSIQAQVVLNEVIFGGSPAVELKNIGNSEINTASYFLCSFPSYTQIQNATVLSGSTLMSPGSILVVTGHNFNTVNDELGLYLTNGFSSPANMLDYVEWGSTGHQRSSVAVSAGIWTTGDFVTLGAGIGSIEYDGSGDSSADWLYAAGNTQGEENSNVAGCEASAFMIGNATRCEGQTANFNVVLTGEAPWTLTYSINGVIQDAIETDNSLYQLVASEAGLYQLTNVSDATCVGTASGSASLTINPLPTGTLFGDGNVCGNGPAELEVTLTGTGPWDIEYHIDGVPQGTIEVAESPYLFNANSEGGYLLVSVEDQFCDGIFIGSVDVTFNPVNGGLLSFVGNAEDTLTICVDDNESDLIALSALDLEGDASAFLLTDVLDQIIEVSTGGMFEFEGGVAETVQLWNISYSTGLAGLMVGSEVPGDLTGCFDLSLPLTVIKQTGAECVTSLSEWITGKDITLFPNPVADVLSITIDKEFNPNVSVSIIDVQGRIMNRQNAANFSGNRLTIDTTTLNPGYYVLRMRGDYGEELNLPFSRY